MIVAARSITRSITLPIAMRGVVDVMGAKGKKMTLLLPSGNSSQGWR